MCLKRAFALLESRWKVDQADHTMATNGGQETLSFGNNVLPSPLFVGVMTFLDPRQAVRSGQACKDWWRTGVLDLLYLTRTVPIFVRPVRSSP